MNYLKLREDNGQALLYNLEEEIAGEQGRAA
jgi:hypothetical protein